MTETVKPEYIGYVKTELTNDEWERIERHFYVAIQEENRVKIIDLMNHCMAYQIIRSQSAAPSEVREVVDNILKTVLVLRSQIHWLFDYPPSEDGRDIWNFDANVHENPEERAKILKRVRESISDMPHISKAFNKKISFSNGIDIQEERRIPTVISAHLARSHPDSEIGEGLLQDLYLKLSEFQVACKNILNELNPTRGRSTSPYVEEFVWHACAEIQKFAPLGPYSIGTANILCEILNLFCIGVDSNYSGELSPLKPDLAELRSFNHAKITDYLRRADRNRKNNKEIPGFYT